MGSSDIFQNGVDARPGQDDQSTRLAVQFGKLPLVLADLKCHKPTLKVLEDVQDY